MKYSLGKQLHSFIYALDGIRYLLTTQQNAWIHLLATICVIALGVTVSLTPESWLKITIAIVLVWIAEALNTSIELLADAVFREFHPLIKAAKDVAAGAVLIAATGAICIGVIVFWPHIF